MPEPESYLALSLASLPPPSHYTISVALPFAHTLTRDQETEWYTQGEEVLVDAASKLDEGWKAVSLMSRCVCSFSHSRSYTFSRSPPQCALPDTHALPRDDAGSGSAHVPVGQQLLPWASDYETDLDDEVSSLREFECGWQTVRLAPLSVPGSVLGIVQPATTQERHKKYWRALIRSDPAYGKFWTVISPIHSKPAPYSTVLGETTQADGYRLSSALSSHSHPYHPSLPSYIRRYPHSRVYWAIPIHGPVLVPGLNHPLAPLAPLVTGVTGVDDAGTVEIPSQLIPSPGFFSPSHSPPPHPRPVIWTLGSLLYFHTQWLLTTLHTPSLGSTSFAYSGPKPDPFLGPSRVAPAPAASSIRTGREEEKNAWVGVIPEMGDHLRLYCSASHALDLRRVIDGIWCPASVSRSVSLSHDAGESGDKVWLFDKARLALVGDRGQVLVVA